MRGWALGGQGEPRRLGPNEVLSVEGPERGSKRGRIGFQDSERRDKTPFGVVHIDQAARFGIFLKSASRLVPDGWVGLKSFGYRCHFRAFQLELATLDTQNIGNGPVVEELQPLEVGRIPKISGKSELSSVSAGMGNSWQ